MATAGSFGARPCRAMRSRILQIGMDAMPKSWRSQWMMQRIRATPPWADMAAIRAVYREAKRQGKTVDHIIPLNSPRVCGLHIPENLQLMDASRNFSKSNAWYEWHGELFAEPEQLRLFA